MPWVPMPPWLSGCPAWPPSCCQLRWVPGEAIDRASTGMGPWLAVGVLARAGHNSIHSAHPQAVRLQGCRPVPQLLPAQRPGAQHRPPLARLRQPRHPAPALLHCGHPGEAAPAGCQGEGLHPVLMPGVPCRSDCPSPGTRGAQWRGGGGQRGAWWRGASAGAPGMILLPRWLQRGALSWLLPLTENRGAGTAAGKVPGEGAGGAGELAQGHRRRG